MPSNKAKLRLMTSLLVLVFVALVYPATSLPSLLPSFTGPSPFIIPPGSYYIDQDITFNLPLAIQGNCLEGETCVSIEFGDFSFIFERLEVETRNGNLNISGIQFQDSSAFNPSGVLYLSPDAYDILLEDVVFYNNSATLLNATLMNSLSISNSRFESNNASKLISIADETYVNPVESITLNNVNFTDNLRPNALASDATISLLLSSIGSLTINECHFLNNPNIFEARQEGAIFGFGVDVLLIQHSTFINNDHTASSTSSAALIDHTPSSSGSWNITNNIFQDNLSPLLRTGSVRNLFVSGNQFDNNSDKLFEAHVILQASFANNLYSRSAGIDLAWDSVAETGARLINNATFTHETFDFDQAGFSASDSIVLTDFNKVIISECLFENISPVLDENSPSLIHLVQVNASNFADTTFKNVSLNTGQVMASRISVAINTIDNTYIVFDNVSFSGYDSSDNVTADFAVVRASAPGPKGTVFLRDPMSLASSALQSEPNINIGRIAVHGSLVIESSIQITDRVFSTATGGLGSISFNNLLYLDEDIPFIGRFDINISSRTKFMFGVGSSASLALRESFSYTPAVDASAGSFLIDLATGMPVLDSSQYKIISPTKSVKYPSNPIQSGGTVIAAKDGSTSNPGFSATLLKTNQNATVVVARAICSAPCLSGVCDRREICTCSSGWSGPTCSCREEGRPPGATCSSQQDEIEWVINTPQTLADLTVPDGLTLLVESDFTITQRISLGTNSRLWTAGTLTLSGTVSIEATSEAYGGSCDIYLPTKVACNDLVVAPGTVIEVNIPTPASCSKRDSSATDNFISDNYDTLIVINGTASLDGSVTVDATKITIPEGRQQRLKVISASSSSTTVSSINVQTDSKICNTVDSKPTLLTVTFSNCGSKGGLKWWYYGAPIIAVGGVLIIVLIIVFSVPAIRMKILPYKSS